MWAIGGGLESADTAPSSDTQTHSHMRKRRTYTLWVQYMWRYGARRQAHTRGQRSDSEGNTHNKEHSTGVVA